MYNILVYKCRFIQLHSTRVCNAISIACQFVPLHGHQSILGYVYDIIWNIISLFILLCDFEHYPGISLCRSTIASLHIIDSFYMRCMYYQYLTYQCWLSFMILILFLSMVLLHYTTYSAYYLLHLNCEKLEDDVIVDLLEWSCSSILNKWHLRVVVRLQIITEINTKQPPSSDRPLLVSAIWYMV